MIICVKPNMLLIQETMVTRGHAREIFSKVLCSWDKCTIDVEGQSRGLLSAWNPKKANFDAFHSVAGILLEGKLFNSDQVVKVVNCYGSYLNRL